MQRLWLESRERSKETQHKHVLFRSWGFGHSDFAKSSVFEVAGAPQKQTI
jgi:hypothetical protein